MRVGLLSNSGIELRLSACNSVASSFLHASSRPLAETTPNQIVMACLALRLSGNHGGFPPLHIAFSSACAHGRILPSPSSTTLDNGWHDHAMFIRPRPAQLLRPHVHVTRDETPRAPAVLRGLPKVDMKRYLNRTTRGTKKCPTS